jgi:hypothetical protein
MSDELLPSVAERRQMVTDSRDAYRRQAYATSIELEALKVQKSEHVMVGGRPVPLRDYIRDLANTGENCRNAAARMQEMLDAMSDAVAGAGADASA